jgi:hypothetical protein
MQTRRIALASIAAFTLAPQAARSVPMVTVHKDPTCGCCTGWAEHLEAAGFHVTPIDTPQINRVKAQLGVPAALWSCHTAEVDGYVIEGHVPASAIQRFLNERPQARGLAVPGMPEGSPGMEVPNSTPQEYTVVLFGDFGQRPYARFKGHDEIPNESGPR